MLILLLFHLLFILLVSSPLGKSGKVENKVGKKGKAAPVSPVKKSKGRGKKKVDTSSDDEKARKEPDRMEDDDDDDDDNDYDYSNGNGNNRKGSIRNGKNHQNEFSFYKNPEMLESSGKFLPFKKYLIIVRFI